MLTPPILATCQVVAVAEGVEEVEEAEAEEVEEEMLAVCSNSSWEASDKTSIICSKVFSVLELSLEAVCWAKFSAVAIIVDNRDWRSFLEKLPMMEKIRWKNSQ